MTRFHISALAAVCMGVAACSSDPLPKGPAKTLKSYPHAADRYARLLRRQLMDPDPVEVEQELSCEQVRMIGALGGDEATLRVVRVEDSVWATAAGRAARPRVLRMVSGQSYQVSGPLCDSLNTIANREDPIVPADTSHTPPSPVR